MRIWIFQPDRISDNRIEYREQLEEAYCKEIDIDEMAYNIALEIPMPMADNIPRIKRIIEEYLAEKMK